MEKFASIEDLYHKLLPALRTKLHEMQREKMIGLEEKDIFLYFCKTKWKEVNQITLGGMVDDILNTPSFTIYTGVKQNG